MRERRSQEPLDRAALIGCGVLTGVGAALNTADIRPGDTVAVIGCGRMGQTIARLAQRFEPVRVVCSPDEAG